MDKAQFTAVLENLDWCLDKSCQLELPEAPHPFPVFVFNPRGVDPDDYEEWMDDTFSDGIPDDLEPAEHVPFCIVGVSGSPFQGKHEGQTEGILFLDMSAAKNGECPILAVDVDGTAIAKTFRKLLDSSTQLKLKVL